MSRIFYLIVGLLAPGAVLAQTQPGMIPGFMSAAGTNGCPTTRACFVPYSATNPLPVDATVTATATTTATASATPTSISAGANQPLNIDLHSSLFVQPTFAGTPVDLTHGLPVNVVAGGAGTSSAFDAAFPANGTAAGLSDGTNMKAWLTALALGDGTNGNNTGAVATWLWNSATYDRARGDATNGAWVNVKTSVLPTGGATAANQATANSSLSTIATNSAAAIPAGTNLIGKVGIDQTTPGTTNGVQVNAAIPAGTNLLGNVGQLYPAGSTPITASATGTTGATTATLAGTSAKSTYICGFSIRANATAAATANSTVTGTVTGTLNYTQWTAPAASGIGLTEQIFSPCVIASGTNTGIAVISAAPGTGGVVSVTAWGFQL